MNINAIAILVAGFFVILYIVIKSLIVYYDIDYYLPCELFRAEWDEKECKYYLQVKRKWSFVYHTCYWEIEECDGNEYYRVTSKNANDLYKALDKKDEMVIFILWHCVPLKLSKDNGKKRY